jgi:FixJ family two-component response regulator
VHGKEDAAAEGTEAFFKKPFEEDDILDVIKRLTGVQEHDVGWTVSLHVVLDGLL